MPRVLIVDDDKFFRVVMTKLLTGHGYDITPAESGEEALRILQTQKFDLMISDVNMTPMDGITLLQQVHESYADMGIIMLTGHDSIDVALEAMKKGAFDFLVKPFQLDELFAAVQRSIRYYNASPESKPLQMRLDMVEGLVAESAGMRKVCDVIRRIAPAKVAVLLCGENGTDKVLIARTLHYYSPQKDEPFMALDCAALSEQQVKSELFGDASAKTSAAQAGLFHAANGGTLFLDNISAMPLDVQAELLDIIQTEKICNIDGTDPAKIDLRVIVASSEKLDNLVKKGVFHENLYYRLSAVRIDIPPLRSRTEDIPLLVDQIIQRNRGTNAEPPALDPKTKEILYNYIWPGDTQELENAIRHALPLVQNGVITKEMLPEEIVEAFEEGNSSGIIANHREQFKGLAFKTFLHGKQEELMRHKKSDS